MGAGIAFKWQSSYYWQSFLVSGTTPAYATLDAQITYLVESAKLQIKLGATNLTNHYYRSYLGGPEIGAMIYTTFTYGINKMIIK
jgi:iron complex outermembrane receptor protein